jgi:hypothetical protein
MLTAALRAPRQNGPAMDRTEPTVYRRTLARAVEIAGSEDKLARFLRLPLADLQAWRRGEADPPSQVFLALVDIVASNALSPAALTNLGRK